MQQIIFIRSLPGLVTDTLTNLIDVTLADEDPQKNVVNVENNVEESVCNIFVTAWQRLDNRKSQFVEPFDLFGGHIWL